MTIDPHGLANDIDGGGYKSALMSAVSSMDRAQPLLRGASLPKS